MESRPPKRRGDCAIHGEGGALLSRDVICAKRATAQQKLRPTDLGFEVIARLVLRQFGPPTAPPKITVSFAGLLVTLLNQALLK